MSSGQAVAGQPTLFLAELTAPDSYVATSQAGDSNSAVDARRVRADDEVVVEYAGVLAAVSLVALTVGGQLGGRLLAALPSTTPVALESLTTGARAERVPVSGAQAAYARAPYGSPC